MIAEPSRREIIRMIWAREMSAGEIAAGFEVTFGAISQHLGVLRRAGLVEVQKAGNRRLYRARRDALAPFEEILEQSWAGALQRLADTIEREESE